MKYNYGITGHKGLIGTELVKRFGIPDFAIDRRDSKDIDVLWGMDNKVDVFFHLAANCRIYETIKDPSLAFENVNGIYTVMEFCRRNKIPKIVYFSSSRVLNEERNPYVASKLYGEELVKGYYECYGIEYLIIRPSTVYGGEDKTHRLMDIWINNAKENKPLVIYGDKNKSLDFTYISDFFKAFEIALDGEWNKEYNISGKCKVKLVKVAKEIIKQTKSESEIVFEAPEMGQPQNVHIKNTVDYKPEVDIKEGVRRCLM